jgi:hypothetical protein
LCAAALAPGAATAGETGRELAKALSQAAVAGDAGAARSAAQKLAQADPGRLEKLLRSDRSVAVRWVALEALVEHGGAERARDACERALGDRDQRLRLGAARAAERLRDPTLLEPMVEALAKAEKIRPDTSWLAQGLLEVLARLTGRDARTAKELRAWLKGAGDEPPLAPQESEDAGGGSGETATGTVPRRLERRPGALETIARIPPEDIVVVLGKWDEAEEVLEELGIPHTGVERGALGQSPLHGGQVIIFNCSDPEGEPTTAEALANVGRAVEAGAWILTSDWEAYNVISKAFPKDLGLGKRTEGDQWLEIRPAPGMGLHPLMRDVFPLSPLELASYRWRIDDDTFTVRPSGRAEVLVHCPELEASTALGTVALAFRVGRRGGRVLHLLGHYSDESADREGGYVLQQLLVNYILEKQRGREGG